METNKKVKLRKAKVALSSSLHVKLHMLGIAVDPSNQKICVAEHRFEKMDRKVTFKEVKTGLSFILDVQLHKL